MKMKRWTSNIHVYIYYIHFYTQGSRARLESNTFYDPITHLLCNVSYSYHSYYNTISVQYHSQFNIIPSSISFPVLYHSKFNIIPSSISFPFQCHSHFNIILISILFPFQYLSQFNIIHTISFPFQCHSHFREKTKKICLIG